MPTAKKIAAKRADLDNGPDIAQQVIDHFKVAIRRAVPIPCSDDDAELIQKGKQPQGPTGLHYVAEQLTLAAEAARRAANSDVVLFTDGSTPTALDELEKIVTAGRPSQTESWIRQEIYFARALPAITQLANELPEAKPAQRLAIVRRIQQSCAFLLEDPESFYDELKDLVTAAR